MPLTARLSNLAASASADALAKLLDNGWLDLMTGEQPSSPDEPLTDQHTVLASLQFSKPAFKSSRGGVADSFPLLSDPNARATGDAKWYRLYKADHKTVVQDGSVGRVNSNLVINTSLIQEGAEVSVKVFTMAVSGKGDY